MFPFILSPSGHGLGTHRQWEALYCGSIPVFLEHNNAMDDIFAGLPAMVVSSWDEVTQESMLCFAVDLLAKSSGFLMDISLPARDSNYYYFNLNILFGPKLAAMCSPVLTAFIKRHHRTHPGYISLNSLDYLWWKRYMIKVVS